MARRGTEMSAKFENHGACGNQGMADGQRKPQGGCVILIAGIK
jgi:hypothetical protein